MTADPTLAEEKRVQAKQARFVQLCRSEDGINTMIVRADAGDLIMVYALVDRLADILAREGSREPADQRRATAFGLLAQPAAILAMLLRHTHDGTPPTKPASRPADAPPPDTNAEPPAWTLADYHEPDDPAPVDHPNIPNHWQQRLRPRPAPEQAAPGWNREPDTPDDLDQPDGSGLRLDLPGLADLLTEQGLKAARPRVVLNVHLTDQTLATGAGVVRTDHPGHGPMLAAQLREFLGTHTCHIAVRPVLDPDHIPSVDAYEIPQRVRDAVRHRHIASVFPYSAATSAGMDLDHTDPYRWDGTPGQTGPPNLGPLTRSEHNAKTHGLWTVTSPHPGVFLWRSPHGHWFLSTNHGTQHLGPLPDTGHPTQTTAGHPAIELAHAHVS